MEDTLTYNKVDQQEPPQDGKPKKLKVTDFAAKIKAKYPEYKDVDDKILTDKIIAKYPEYKEQVDFDLKKKSVGNSPLPSQSNGEGLRSLKNNFPWEGKTPVAALDLTSTGEPQVSKRPIQPRVKTVEEIAQDYNKTAPADQTAVAKNPSQIEINDRLGREETHKKNIDIAIDNTAKQYFKNKGIKTGTNSQIFQEQKQKIKEAFVKGDVAYHMDLKTNTPRLDKITGFWSNASKGWNEAMDSNDEAATFVHDMNTQQRVDFVKQKQQAKSQQAPSEFLDERMGGMGWAGHTAGGAAPFLAKAGAGIVTGAAALAAAPETLGASLAGLPIAMSFIYTAPDMANQGGMNETLSRYQSLKQQHPEISDYDAMKEAESGLLTGGVAGIAENALFMKNFKLPISNEGKMVLGKFATETLQSGVNMGAATAAVDVGKNVVSNIEGYKKTPKEIAASAAKTFTENATVGMLLHGMINGVPKVLNSAFKYALKDAPKEEITNILNSNVEAGNISQEQAQKTAQDIDGYNEALDKINPRGLSETSQASIAGLIQAKDNIKKEAETKDESVRKPYQDKIEAINAQISDIQRTNKPFEHEVDDLTGNTLRKPQFDDVAKQRVEDIADKISKGKSLEDVVDVQTESKFPEQVETQLNKILREEKSANKDKENPNNEITNNITKYLERAKKENEGVVVEPPKKVAEVVPLEENTTHVEPPKQIPESVPLVDEENKIPVTQEEGSLAASNNGENIPPTESPEKVIGEAEGEQKIAGIAQRVREQRSDVLGLEPAEIGVGWTKEEALQRGRELMQDGIEPQEVVDEFNKDGKISDDTVAIVQAHTHKLARETNTAGDKYGLDSKEYKEALQREDEWLKATKPMQTVWSRAGVAQQGDIDIDTGSVTGLSRAFKQETGRDFTPYQKKEATVLSKKVSELTQKTQELEAKIKELLDKETAAKPKSEKAIKEAADKLAKKIRDNAKLSRPDTFSAASPASLIWDGAVEIVAKTIEAGGTIAQGIADGVKHIEESEWYKNLSKTEQKNASKTFTDWNKEQNVNKFSEKKGNSFTPEEAKEIWQHAKKNYLNKGDGFEKMIQGTAIDLGLKPDQVRHALSQPKEVKRLTDEMYKAQYHTRMATQKATLWVKNANRSRLAKIVRAVPDVFFGIKTFGHGTVGALTHAGTSIFKPSRWKQYWPFFGRQFKYAFGKTADYEKAMTDLKNDPDFLFWKRAGLAVDPKESYDEYQRVGRFMGRIASTGERGFNALKWFRLELAKSYYDKLSESSKADPNTAKEIAKLVNHASGTSEIKLPNAANVVFFAPRLEASRWHRLITDPAKALVTFTKWNKATEAEKVRALREAKNTGEIIATYMSALAANAGLLAATGASQSINFTDPTKSDWLKFKVGGKTLDFTGGMLSSLNFLAGMIETAITTKESIKSRADKMAQSAWIYGTGKFSPFAGTVKDFATHKDFSGNVMPFSNDEPAKGKRKLTWLDYILEQQTPIPIAEGIKEARQSMIEKGMDTKQVDDILKGIAAAVIVGGTGVKIGNEPSVHLTPTHTKKQKKTKPKKKQN